MIFQSASCVYYCEEDQTLDGALLCDEVEMCELSKINGENNSKKSKESKASDNNETVVDETIITEEQLYKDAQLKSAVDILKALIITNKGNK